MVALSFIIYHLSFSPAGAQEHSKYIQAVDEYRPAPGQYVNDAPEYEAGDTEADMISTIPSPTSPASATLPSGAMPIRK